MSHLYFVCIILIGDADESTQDKIDNRLEALQDDVRYGLPSVNLISFFLLPLQTSLSLSPSHSYPTSPPLTSSSFSTSLLLSSLPHTLSLLPSPLLLNLLHFLLSLFIPPPHPLTLCLPLNLSLLPSLPPSLLFSSLPHRARKEEFDFVVNLRTNLKKREEELSR
jgi:hypothetical protein